MSGFTSTAKCAKMVRIALESAGAKIQSHPVAASDWGDTLKKIGYRQIQPAFDHPKVGDIYIIKRTKTMYMVISQVIVAASGFLTTNNRATTYIVMMT